jgi:hypothetical protein
MSDRPQRERKAAPRFNNNQARNMEVAAARAAARAAAKAAARPGTAKPKPVKPRTAVATPRNGTLPRGKDSLIPRLIPLISQVTSDEDLQHFLISIYDETSNDEYTKSLFGGKTEDEAKEKIAVHVDLFSNKLYRGSTPQMTFNLKGDDMINLAYLMYLDMLHDETIKKDMTFETFCEKDITVSVKVPAPTKKDKKKTKMVNTTQRSPVYILFGTGLRPKETDFIKTVQGFIDRSGGKAEIAVKNNLPSIYPNILKEEMTIRQDQVSPRMLTPGHNMFLSVDQEDEKATVTLDIRKTKYNIPGGGTAKIMYPLVSVANLMDPGKNMLIESAKEDSKYFMLGLNNKDISSRLTWNYEEPKFTINHNNGSTTIGAYYTDKALNLNSKNRKTKRGYAYLIENNKGVYRYSSNMSKAKAQTGSTGEKVAKFLGDFLQALTVTSYVKNNTNNKYHYCLATGDAMLANNFIFLCSRSGVSPNLWMATSTKQVSKVYGNMINHIQVAKPAPTQVINAPIRNEGTGNTNQEASSGSNRTEGSGNSNNRGFLGRIFGGNSTRRPNATRSQVNNGTRGPNATRSQVNNGTRRPNATRSQVNNRVVNRKPVNNGVRRMNVNNAVSVAGSSSGSVSRNNNNNNNNNVSSNNRRGVKRARNNNNNVSQPTAKRVVSTNIRNKLIQNLKKRNLPNAVINSYVRSYNNGRKSVNQIIQEVRNNAKRRQNAKNAAAFREYKKLRPELFKN